MVPIGTMRSTWEDALAVGLRFASEFIDRPAGRAGAVIYGGGLRPSFVVYWTRSRRVVVYLQDAEEVRRG